jgi:DNA mismatch endonuclease, patch repair protein
MGSDRRSNGSGTQVLLAKRVSSNYTPWPDVPEARRRIMSAIRSRDTQPELLVRRLLHAEGYRFAVGRRISGYRPDILFTRRRKVVLVHGCFWHGHLACRRHKLPKTRSDYWRDKIQNNKARDERAQKTLEASAWRILILWECEIRGHDELKKRLANFLGPPQWPSHSRS